MSTKSVFAHFMVGNTYPYTMNDWQQDILLAVNNHLDGFALNVGCEPWQKDRVADCFEALTRTNLPFKLFLSFDMHSVPGNKAEDADTILGYIASFASHPAMYRYNGRVVVSTFSGEHHTFGQGSFDRGWAFLRWTLEKVAPIHFIPSFFLDPATFMHLPCVDGDFNWNGGWPLHLNVNSPRHEVECPQLDSDKHHQRHIHGKTFMAAVSPWFFTHYGRDSWNKNWIYRGDDWLLARRWEQLIAMRDQIDIVQVISWNDYGESHYIGPIAGAQPNSEAWVNGYPHNAWLVLNAYYCRAFKEGRYPTIERDVIFAWARPHLKGAQASSDKVNRPEHWQLTDDKIWIVIFSTGPAVLAMHKNEYSVGAGITKTWMPLQVGRGIDVTLRRQSDGVVLVRCAPSLDQFCCTEHPEVYNFNAFTAMSVS